MESTAQLKEVVAFALSLHKAYDSAKADGKIDLADLAHLVDPMMKLVAAVDGASSVPAELKDLDDAERADLMVWAKAEYDIADDVLEAKVEGGLDLALHLASYLGVVGVYKQDPPPAA